jgi:hypothetical protein
MRFLLITDIGNKDRPFGKFEEITFFEPNTEIILKFQNSK